jgi:hypothetical protein
MAYRIFNLLLRYYSNEHSNLKEKSFNISGEDQDNLYQGKNNFSSIFNTTIHPNKIITLGRNNTFSPNKKVIMNSTTNLVKSSHVGQLVNANKTVVNNYNKSNNKTLPTLSNNHSYVNASKNTSKISIALKHNKIKQPSKKKMLNISSKTNLSYNLMNKSLRVMNHSDGSKKQDKTSNSLINIKDHSNNIVVNNSNRVNNSKKINKIWNQPTKIMNNTNKSQIIMISSIFTKNLSNFSLNSNVTSKMLSYNKMNETNVRRKEENLSEIFKLLNEYQEISKSLINSSDPLDLYNKFKDFQIKNNSDCKQNVTKSSNYNKNLTNSSLNSNVSLHNKSGTNKTIRKKMTMKNKVNSSIHISKSSSNFRSVPRLKNFTLLNKTEMPNKTHLITNTNPHFNTTLKNGTINKTKLDKDSLNNTINKGKKEFKRLKTKKTKLINNNTNHSIHKNKTKQIKEIITKFDVDYDIFKNKDGLEKIQKVEDENDVYNDFRITELAEVEKEPKAERRFLK